MNAETNPGLEIDRTAAIDLLHELVSIPSVSHEEHAATRWLADQMNHLGYDRSYVDAAGNAVGEVGPQDATRTIVLLGHIDTVPGNIPVRIEEGEAGKVLFGRGSVDAKGPLATFTAAVARVGSVWAHERQIRLVVVGAVEEEAATSKGARFIRDRFNGDADPIPDYCIIGEPSGSQRITLGYKGRLLIQLEAEQPMAHTAGPAYGIASVVVDFWNWLAKYVDTFNSTRAKAFEQLLPSLRDVHTWTDDAMNDCVRATVGIRLPLDYAVDRLVVELCEWAAHRSAADSPPPGSLGQIEPGEAVTFRFSSSTLHISLHLRGYEPAWRSERAGNPLVRALITGIRTVGDRPPRFVEKTGTSDMNVVGPSWQCPIVAYGPGDSTLDHTPNEHILLEEYWQAVLVLEETLRQLALTA